MERKEVKLSLPRFSLTSNRRTIGFGHVKDAEEIRLVIYLDDRIVGNTSMAVSIQNEDDFARLWDCIEREFSDLVEDHRG